jgi:hypothetical protein
MQIQNRVEQPALFSEIPAKRFRRSRRRFRSRWATCVHEAAHAIVALWFRIAFAAATIRPSMGSVAGSLILNHETSVVPDGKSLIEVAAQLAVVMAAGYVAEKRWGFEPVNHDFVETSDYTAMLRLPGLGEAPREKQEIYAVTALTAARQLLDLQPIRSAMLLLAGALETRITLSHAEAMALAEQVWRREGGAVPENCCEMETSTAFLPRPDGAPCRPPAVTSNIWMFRR